MSIRLIDSFFGINETVDQPKLTWSVRLAIWRDRRASRRQLAELDDAMLNDIGLTRAQAIDESRRAVWQGEFAPHWSSHHQAASKAGLRRP